MQKGNPIDVKSSQVIIAMSNQPLTTCTLFQRAATFPPITANFTIHADHP